MDVFEGPTDIFGMAIYHSLTEKMEENPKYRKFINKIEENILLELDYYPLMVKFGKDSLEITREIIEKPSVKVKIKAQDFLNIIDGKSTMIRTFLRGKMGLNFKGLLKIMKVYKIFSNIMS